MGQGACEKFCSPRLRPPSYSALAPQVPQIRAAPRPQAGHVVTHGNKTVLFADGDGSVQILNFAAIADPQAQITKFQAAAAH